MALIETLQDNFNDNSVDTSKWNAVAWGNATVTEAGGHGVISFPNPTVGSDDGSYESDAYYDLTGSSISYQVINYLDVYDSSCWLSLQLDYANRLQFELWGGTLYAIKRVSDVQTNLAEVAYDADSHAWQKISESDGTVTFWVSGNGINWTSFATTATPITITDLRVYIEGITWAEDVSNPGTFEFDNVNIIPSSTNTTNFFQMF